MTALEQMLDDNALALHFRQRLEPVDGRDTAVYPPTYAAPESVRGAPPRQTPYPVNELRDGTKVVTMDSIQSQANRMENAFGLGGDLNSYVPRVGVRVTRQAEDGTSATIEKHVTELGHRIADAAIRTTPHVDDIRAAFSAYARGDCVPVARLCPTALIYGAWDSRDTRVKIPRMVRAEILARDIDVLSRPAQFTGAFSREELGLDEKAWGAKAKSSGSRSASAGYAHSPSDGHGTGGVLVRGEIVHSAAVHLGALSEIGRSSGEALRRYLLCLALAALYAPRGGRDYTLRSGCWLMPDGPPEVTLATRQGERRPLPISDESPLQWLREAADEAQRPPTAIDVQQDRFEEFDTRRAQAALVDAGKNPAPDDVA